MRIDIVVYDGTDELDAIGPLEVFRNAQQLGADSTVRLVTRDAQKTVQGSHGLVFIPDAVLHARSRRRADHGRFLGR